MNYWFLYYLDNGMIHGAPYLGYIDEWTNIPEGCGVVGPIPEDDAAAKDASGNPDFYTVESGILVPMADIDERRAELSARPVPPDADEELSKAIQAATTLDELKTALTGSNGKLAKVRGKLK